MAWRETSKFWGQKISLNVLGIRRSSPPYKANRRFAVGWNVGERKLHKGRKPDCNFSNPEPPNRRRSVYRLLCDVFLLFNYFCFQWSRSQSKLEKNRYLMLFPMKVNLINLFRKMEFCPFFLFYFLAK